MKKITIISLIISALAFGLFLEMNPSYLYRLQSYIPVEAYNPASLEIILKKDCADYINNYRVELDKQETMYPKANYCEALFISKGDTSKVKLRPKGDFITHLKRDNWSFRIKQEKGSKYFYNNKKLSFHDPCERNFIFEYVFHEFLKNEGILALDYDFVLLKFNGSNYCYAIEDAIGKSYLEKNKLKGPVYKFDETALFQQAEKLVGSDNKSDLELYNDAKLLVRGGKVKESSTHFLNVRAKYGFPVDSFNTDQVAKFIAICDLFGAKHALRWHNLKLVKRNGLMEFIGSDANPIYDPTLSIDLNLPMLDVFFQSKEFVGIYKEYLTKYMDEDYIMTFLNDKDTEINSRIKLLQEYYPLSDNNLAFIFANIKGFPKY